MNDKTYATIVDCLNYIEDTIEKGEYPFDLTDMDESRKKEWLADIREANRDINPYVSKDETNDHWQPESWSGEIEKIEKEQKALDHISDMIGEKWECNAVRTGTEINIFFSDQSYSGRAFFSQLDEYNLNDFGFTVIPEINGFMVTAEFKK